MKIKIVIILIISVLLLSGCSNSNFSNSNIDNNSKESNIMQNSAADFEQEEIAIYQINSDAFDRLLESNSFDSISDFSSKCHSYPKDGNKYITYDTTLFEITSEFIDFIKNKSVLEEYFCEDNPNEKIEGLVIFEAPYVPISVWIKTNIDTYFLTVNEEYSGSGQVYNLYSQSDYIEKYKSQQFTLEINGNIALNSESIKTYYEHSELPLLKILSSINAEVKWKNENIVNITLNKETYLLDVKNNIFYKKHHKKNNLLSNCSGGGPYHMYLSNGEYYVDSDTLQGIMLESGQKISIEYDTEQKIVSIITV